jgi:hypothetical protein
MVNLKFASSEEHTGWEAVGGDYQDPGLTQHTVRGTDQISLGVMCVLTGYVKTSLIKTWAGGKKVEVARIQSSPCSDLLRKAVFPAAVSWSIDGSLFEYNFGTPPKVHLTTQGVVELELPPSTTIEAGSTVHVSLAGIRAIAQGASAVTFKLHQNGRSLAQCHDKHKAAKDRFCAKNMTADDRKRKLNDCATTGLDQRDAELVQLDSEQNKFWPAPLCGLSGNTIFTKQGSEPGLVALLPIHETKCFPMRGVDLVVFEEGTHQLVHFTLEPQGVLRMEQSASDARTSITLQTQGIMWNPDVVQQPQSVDCSNGCVAHTTTAIYPVYPARVTLSQDFEPPERKGLVKDAILFQQDEENMCGCHAQKRLICQRLWNGGFQCSQYKRLVRAFKMVLGGKRQKNFNTAMYACNLDDTKPKYECHEMCTNRLLAL